MERRELLKIGVVAAAAGRVVEAQGQHKFFSPEHFAVVDELMEIIIPADDHSPGARGAQCAAFVDGRLAEEPDATIKESWRAGIHQMSAMGFLAATPEARVAMVERIANGKFFALVKEATIHAYYTSKIGIHQEMEYKGNVVLNTFVGTEP